MSDMANDMVLDQTFGNGDTHIIFGDLISSICCLIWYLGSRLLFYKEIFPYLSSWKINNFPICIPVLYYIFVNYYVIPYFIELHVSTCELTTCKPQTPNTQKVRVKICNPFILNEC